MSYGIQIVVNSFYVLFRYATTVIHAWEVRSTKAASTVGCRRKRESPHKNYASTTKEMETIRREQISRGRFYE